MGTDPGFGAGADPDRGGTGKILATRGKKNATLPCATGRRDGIMERRHSCPFFAAALSAGSG